MRSSRAAILAVAVAAALILSPGRAGAGGAFHIDVGLEAGGVYLPGYPGTYGRLGYGKALVLGAGVLGLTFEMHLAQSYVTSSPGDLSGKGLGGSFGLLSFLARYQLASWLALSAGVASTSTPVVVDAASPHDVVVSGIGGVVGAGVGTRVHGGYLSLELRAAKSVTELPSSAYLVSDGAGGYVTSTEDVAPWFVTLTVGIRSQF